MTVSSGWLADWSTASSLGLGLGVGFLVGAALAAALVMLRMRDHRYRAAAIQSANEAVLSSQIEGRNRELSQQQHAYVELQQRLQTCRDRMDQLQISEAEMRTRLSASQVQEQDLKGALAEAQTVADELRSENSALQVQLTRMQTQLSEQEKRTSEKLQLLDEAREVLGHQFRNLANEIFEARGQAFREQNQSQLNDLLAPLSEKIRDFQSRVEDTYSKESRERFSLTQEVRQLQELNHRISEDAVNLTNALKGENKTQGNWGEVILERVLENSGLHKGREYETQVNLRSEEGRRWQPDVVVHLPENKDVVIDAKVSLVAYEHFCSATDADEQIRSIGLHVRSVRRHVRQLSEKNYQSLYQIRTLDFVLMFVPVEAAFVAALQHDPALYSDAFKHNVMLVSPSTLLATLRMIHNIWRFERQNQNAQEIAQRAGALYDKFVNFTRDLEDVGQRLQSVQNAYDKARNKLSEGKGNLVSRAESMRELGAKTSKTLPENLVTMPLRREPGGSDRPAVDDPPATVRS